MSDKTPAAPPNLVEAELRLVGGLNEKLFRLLAAIEASGSINQAAKAVGLSYKGAWEMVERANNLSPRVLVSTAVGGRHGGGTALTQAGRSLLALYQRLQEQHRQFLQQLNSDLAVNPEFLFLARRMLMKASARNQFSGTVEDVIPGAVNAEVVVALKGGDTLVASVTMESLKTLGIAKGVEVVALVKAPLVMIVTDMGPYRLSARNQLAGTVARVQKGAVNCEVVIQLPGGNTVYSTITNDAVEDLALQEGGKATAVFKAGSVILGVAA